VPQYRRQQEELDNQNLRYNAAKECGKLLRSLIIPAIPFHPEHIGQGLLTSAAFQETILRLQPFPHHSELHSNLQTGFRNMVHVLNYAYTLRGGVYESDSGELARAFRLAAGWLEWSLAQHVASTLRRAPVVAGPVAVTESDGGLLSRFSSLSITNSSNQNKPAISLENLHTRRVLAIHKPRHTRLHDDL
jgi:hypothetical protein